MTEHTLKTWPEFFQAIVDDRKPFEYRLNDRDYQEGDVLHLQEYVPNLDWTDEDPDELMGHYTGRELRKSVSYVLHVEELGPAAGARIASARNFVILGLAKLYVGPDIEPSPWVPMSDPVDIKVVGKNMEELGEAITALARALIQGIDGTEPSTGKVNRQWVQDELSDVGATSAITAGHFSLNAEAMGERMDRKRNFLGRWLKMMSA